MLGKGWREWQGALLGERKRRLGVLQGSSEPHPPSLGQTAASPRGVCHAASPLCGGHLKGEKPSGLGGERAVPREAVQHSCLLEMGLQAQPGVC